MSSSTPPSELPARTLAGVEPAGDGRIYDRAFFLLCGGTVVFMASFGMLLPELPAHLAAMGGEAYLGGVVGMFTLAAFLSRFLSGRIADNRQRRWSCSVCRDQVAGFGYLVATTIATFLALRFFHGLSTGFRPPGTSAMLTDRIPKSRRGEALGYLGVAGTRHGHWPRLGQLADGGARHRMDVRGVRLEWAW